MAGNRNSGGHNAKATHLHVLQGTFRKDRHATQQTPEVPSGQPQPPRPLSGQAKAEWDRMTARLEQACTLSLVDDAALYQYVQLFAENEAGAADVASNRRLIARLKKAALAKLEGPELVRAIETLVDLQRLVNRASRDLRQGHMAIRQYLVEFGMTPASRTRVKVSPAAKPATTDKHKRFFGSPDTTGPRGNGGRAS